MVHLTPSSRGKMNRLRAFLKPLESLKMNVKIFNFFHGERQMANVDIYTLFFYKEPTSRPSSKSSLFVDLKSANCSTKSSLIVP